MLNRRQAIQQMNVWGSTGQPFYFIVDFEGTSAIVSSTKEGDGIAFDFHNQETKPQQLKTLEFHSYPKSLDQYQQQFETVSSHIHYGNSFLVNLTHQTPIKCNYDLKEIYHFSRAKYKVLWDERFVCFSPETFIRTENDKVYSHPMKGTIDGELPDAAAKILADPKEMAEHITIVDLIRNDLSMISENVKVTKFRYIDRLKTNHKSLLQVSTEISGTLKENWQANLGNMIFQLLPAGSITGAPKEQTMSIIREAEDYKRGYYTGICGYFDGENLDTGVMIRFIEKKGDALFFKSGGGITAFSKVASEYQEMIDKIYVPVY